MGPHADCRWWLVSLVLAFALSLHMASVGYVLEDKFLAKDGAASLQLARNPAVAHRILTSWNDRHHGADTIAVARALLVWDHLLIPLYTMGLFGACRAAALKFDSPWDSIVKQVAWLPIVAGVLDMIENDGLNRMLATPSLPPSTSLYLLVAAPALLKWLLLLASMWFVLCGLVIWFYELIVPSARRAATENPAPPVSTSEVINAELDHMAQGRPKPIAERSGPGVSDRDDQEAARRAYKSDLFGLALSGGGIRSATFALGALTSLARHRLLARVDILSTVSGGGYIGSWLSAWILRAQGVDRVQSALSTTGQSVREIEFLRGYSNFLTPRTGLLSLDTWAAVATWTRNVSINLAVLLAFLWSGLATLLFLVHAASIRGLAIGAIAVILAFAATALLTLGVGVHEKSWRHLLGNHKDLISCTRWLGPLGAVAVFLAALGGGFWLMLWAFLNPGSISIKTLAIVAIPGLMLWAIASGVARAINLRAKVPVEAWREWFYFLGAIGAGIVTAVAVILYFASLLPLLTPSFQQWSEDSRWFHTPSALRTALAATFGPPVVLLGVTAGVILSIALLGRLYSDKGREWWARVGGAMALSMLAWCSLVGSIFAIPGLVYWLNDLRGSQFDMTYVLGSAWAIVTAVTGLVARQGDAAVKVRFGTDLILRLGPYFAASGFYVIAVYGFYVVSYKLFAFGIPYPLPNAPLLLHVGDGIYFLLNVKAGKYLLMGLGCATIGLLISLCADVNLFSLRDFYKNRLVCCYLGATNPDRPDGADPFTKLAASDDLELSKLVGHARPYHILNGAMNIVHGHRLAWQERKAAPFIFSPLHCGYSLPVLDDRDFDCNYRSTYRFADDGVDGRGLTLGGAMALSGAALSPNRGQGSTPVLTLLMTLLNIRLGAWLPNPRFGARASSPPVAARYLISELFGRTNDQTRYVNVSDGGHFENLGVYELVRRRCRTIVVVDAGLDEQRKFDDLGNCIRKCAIDLNVRIELDVTRLIPYDGRLSEAAWASGRILYPSIGGEPQEGVILYLKSSLIEPVRHDAGLLNYLGMQPPFPHHSTLDQWFGESTFESYRALGERLCDAMCAKHKGVLGIG